MFSILEANWELNKNLLKGTEKTISMDITSSCYVEFGTYGISIYRYRYNKWYRKIVNGWKDLSFSEFLEKFKEEEWEKIK